MSNVVITLSAEAKGTFAKDADNKHSFYIEPDHIITDNGVFDNRYRLSLNYDEITVTQLGQPVAVVVYNSFSGEWQVSYMLEGHEPLRLQLYVEQYDSIRQAALRIKPSKYQHTVVRQLDQVYSFWSYELPNEHAILVAVPDFTTIALFFMEGVEQAEVTHECWFETREGSVLKKNGGMILKGQDREYVIRLACLHQALNYAALQAGGTDPYWAFGDVTQLVVRELQPNGSSTVMLTPERNDLNQPRLIGKEILTTVTPPRFD